MQRTIAAGKVADLVSGVPFGSGPAYAELASALRRVISDGRIPPGVRLPSERELTRALDLSRTTISRAYEQLRELGYLRSRQGSGSIATLPGGAPARRTSALTPGTGAPDAVDLTCAALGAPPGFLAATEAALSRLPAHLPARGYHPLGLPELRAELAERFQARGLDTDPEQVMVTSGALAGVAAALRALAGPGDRVLLESPTYPNAIETVRRLGARPVALPLDPTGWDTTAFVATVRQTAPRAAYLVPDFHNPTGALMPTDQRGEIAAALRSGHTVPVVDETLVDLDLHPDADADPKPPLALFHPRAVTVGSASKTYWGGVRVGWVRAAREEFAAVAEARLTFDLSASLLDQLVLLELLRQRDQLVAERRAAVRTSRDALVAALRSRLPSWHVQVPRGGLSLWIELPAPLSYALTVAAERRDVVLAGGSQFAVEGSMERFLRIPYGDVDPETLTEVVARLVPAWEEAQRTPVRARGHSRMVA